MHINTKSDQFTPVTVVVTFETRAELENVFLHLDPYIAKVLEDKSDIIKSSDEELCAAEDATYELWETLRNYID